MGVGVGGHGAPREVDAGGGGSPWRQGRERPGRRPLELSKEGCGSTAVWTVWKDSWQNCGGRRMEEGRQLRTVGGSLSGRPVLSAQAPA